MEYAGNYYGQTYYAGTTSLGIEYTLSFAETTTLSEVRIIKAIKPVLDTVTPSEPMYIKQTRITRLDQVTISEIYAKIKQQIRTFIDTITSSEPTFKRATNKKVIDTTTPSEIIKKASFFPKLENLTITDLIELAQLYIKMFIDSITSTDVRHNQVGVSKVDEATITDNKYNEISVREIDTITMSDIFSKVRSLFREFVESIILTEIQVKKTAKTWLDTVTMSMTMIYPRFKLFIEEITITDSKVFTWIKNLFDTVTASDIYTRLLNKFLHIWRRILKPITTWLQIDKPITTWIRIDRPTTTWTSITKPTTAWTSIDKPENTWTRIDQPV